MLAKVFVNVNTKKVVPAGTEAVTLTHCELSDPLIAAPLFIVHLNFSYVPGP